MTKRSEKGVGNLVNSLVNFGRNLRVSGWRSDVNPDSVKDRPIEIANMVKAAVDDAIFRLLDGGILSLDAPTTDFIAFDTADAITVNGSVYTVNRSFFAIINGTMYKVNTGSDTQADTMRLVLSSTTDGPYQTLDIQNGTSGSGVVDYISIRWMGAGFRYDPVNQKLRVKDIVDEDDTGAPNFPRGLTSPKIKWGTHVSTLNLSTSTGVVVITIPFNHTFNSPPTSVFVVARQPSGFNDVQTVTVKNITTTQFEVNWYRIDSFGGGTGDDQQFDWMAFE